MELTSRASARFLPMTAEKRQICPKSDGEPNDTAQSVERRRHCFVRVGGYDLRAGCAVRARFRGFGRGGGVLGPPDGPPFCELFVGGAPCSSQRHKIICSAV